MKGMSVRNKILLLAGVVLAGILVFAGIVLLDIVRSTPSEETVKREFLIRYPNATIRNLELIFEQDGSVVYLVTAREDKAPEEGKYDFGLLRSNGSWAWCDDQTDHPCGPIAK
ncbi:MAG: hypothetical protein ABI791_01600 [Acidobacteriota bacterium]